MRCRIRSLWEKNDDEDFSRFLSWLLPISKVKISFGFFSSFSCIVIPDMSCLSTRSLSWELLFLSFFLRRSLSLISFFFYHLTLVVALMRSCSDIKCEMRCTNKRKKRRTCSCSLSEANTEKIHTESKSDKDCMSRKHKKEKREEKELAEEVVIYKISFARREKEE